MTSSITRANGPLQVYTEFRLTHFPTLTPLIAKYAQGSDPVTSVGPYFQRPGRTILERYLVDVPEPSAILGGDTSLQMHRVYFCGQYNYPLIL